MLSYVIVQLHSDRAAVPAAAAVVAATTLAKVALAVEMLVRYRAHLNNSNNRKQNKQKADTITHQTVLENVSVKVICVNTPSSLV